MPGIPSPGGGGAGGFDISSMMGGMMGGGTKNSAAAAATARNETEAIVQKMGGPVMGSFKKGGIVPKTGNYQLHKGEAVVPAKLGSGARFAALKSKLGHQKGIHNPAALAAAIGRKKYGAKKMGQLSAGGR